MSARPSTPDRKNPDGSTTVTVQRCCNGCGNPIGDVTDAEIDGSIAGLRLPDVRDECPTCTPEATRPALPDRVAAKAREGHTFENDSPGGLSSVNRWTCTVCGDAVLMYGTNVYGGATERTCEQSISSWKRVP